MLIAGWNGWRSGGAVHLLVGNLETGATGDSRLPRTVRVSLNAAALDLAKGPSWYLQAVDDHARIMPSAVLDGQIHFDITIRPDGAGVYQLYPNDNITR